MHQVLVLALAQRAGVLAAARVRVRGTAAVGWRVGLVLGLCGRRTLRLVEGPVRALVLLRAVAHTAAARAQFERLDRVCLAAVLAVQLLRRLRRLRLRRRRALALVRVREQRVVALRLALRVRQCAMAKAHSDSVRAIAAVRAVAGRRRVHAARGHRERQRRGALSAERGGRKTGGCESGR